MCISYETTFATRYMIYHWHGTCKLMTLRSLLTSHTKWLTWWHWSEHGHTQSHQSLRSMTCIYNSIIHHALSWTKWLVTRTRWYVRSSTQKIFASGNITQCYVCMLWSPAVYSCMVYDWHVCTCQLMIDSHVTMQFPRVTCVMCETSNEDPLRQNLRQVSYANSTG